MIAPWNASWTAEDTYEIRPCRWAGGKLAIWSPHKPGEGKPIFAKPHMVRQRRSIAEMRSHSHAQWEIQQYANALRTLAAQVAPVSVAAWAEGEAT